MKKGKTRPLIREGEKASAHINFVVKIREHLGFAPTLKKKKTRWGGEERPRIGIRGGLGKRTFPKQRKEKKGILEQSESRGKTNSKCK